jgi:hypothetical protein
MDMSQLRGKYSSQFFISSQFVILFLYGLHKPILKAWAESEDALTGFYHGILDEVETRVHVKALKDLNPSPALSDVL